MFLTITIFYSIAFATTGATKEKAVGGWNVLKMQPNINGMVTGVGWCRDYSKRQNWSESNEETCVRNCQQRKMDGRGPIACEFSSSVGSCSAFWGEVTRPSGISPDPYGNDYVCWIQMVDAYRKGGLFSGATNEKAVGGTNWFQKLTPNINGMVKGTGWCRDYSKRQNWYESNEETCVRNCQKRRKDGKAPSACEFSSSVGSCSAFWGFGRSSGISPDPYGNDYVCYQQEFAADQTEAGDTLAMHTPNTFSSGPNFVLNVFAAVGFCVTLYGAFRHYTSTK